MRILLCFALISLYSARAHGQDCAGVPDGSADATNACRLCDKGVFRFLPEHTDCGESRCWVGPMGEGMYRDQCRSGAAEGETVCTNVFKGVCPGGNVCAPDETCGTTCASDDDCVPEYECVDSFCARRAIEPPADMGVAQPDMGVADDVGEPADTADTAPAEPDTGNPQEDGSHSETGVTRERKGCTTAPESGGSVIWILVAIVLGVRRRRTV